MRRRHLPLRRYDAEFTANERDRDCHAARPCGACLPGWTCGVLRPRSGRARLPPQVYSGHTASRSAPIILLLELVPRLRYGGACVVGLIRERIRLAYAELPHTLLHAECTLASIRGVARFSEAPGSSPISNGASIAAPSARSCESPPRLPGALLDATPVPLSSAADTRHLPVFRSKKALLFDHEIRFGTPAIQNLCPEGPYVRSSCCSTNSQLNSVRSSVGKPRLRTLSSGATQ